MTISDLPRSTREPGAEIHGMLTRSLIAQIDRALRRVGEFGEVRLIVAKGRLRFIETTQSEPASGFERELERGFRREGEERL